ncbi:MAG: vWA domain-containing protein [Angustibacter sp.]
MTAPTGGGRVALPDVVRELAGFARALRFAGVPVTPDRTVTYVRAVAEVGIEDRAAVYWAGRATLCADPEHLRTYDLTFADWFEGQMPPRPARIQSRSSAEITMAALDGGTSGIEAEQEREPLRVAASAVEVVRHRDVAELDPAGREQVRRLLTKLDTGIPVRRSARRRPSSRGRLDVRRIVREELRRGGVPGPLRYHRGGQRPRRVVWLIDVSGSMLPYADVLLRLAHAQLRVAAGGVPGLPGRARVEVFTIGTRLTRVTTGLGHRDVERALRCAGRQVPDWSGGTRLGETLRVFEERWGRPGLVRGAVLVICSDGWERGDPALLAEQVGRLSRLAHRVVWVNPHRGKDGYQPVQRGMAAVLPWVDDFVAGHSVDAYARLMEVVAGA